MTEAFLWVLQTINQVISNYGITIIIITVLVRLALLPLDIMQKKNQRKTMEIQPKVDAINKKYANDAQKRNEKTLELYRKEKFSPFKGCLPLLIQLPFLFIFLSVLRGIADSQLTGMVQAVSNGQLDVFSQLMKDSHFLWINNLWQPDSMLEPIFPAVSRLMQLNIPNMTEQSLTAVFDTIAKMPQEYTILANGYFILPILAGATQFLQTRLMGSAAGSAGNQMKVMNIIFPLLSVYICATSTASFALYWLASNVYAIILQLILNKIYHIDKAKEKDQVIT